MARPPAAARRVPKIVIFPKSAISEIYLTFCAAPIASDLGPQAAQGAPWGAQGAQGGPWAPPGGVPLLPHLCAAGDNLK